MSIPRSIQGQVGWGFEYLVKWKVSLPLAGGLELDDLEGPFQPKPLYDSTKKACNWCQYDKNG